jgi:hypothetical protein
LVEWIQIIYRLPEKSQQQAGRMNQTEAQKTNNMLTKDFQDE